MFSLRMSSRERPSKPKIVFVTITMLSVLALSIGLGCFKNSSYYKNTTPQADLNKVVVVWIERPMTGVGEAATIDKTLIQNLIKATQIGV